MKKLLFILFILSGCVDAKAIEACGKACNNHVKVVESSICQCISPCQ